MEMHMAVVSSVASSTMAMAAQATTTAVVEAAMATATGMGMGMSMGGSSGCKLSVSRLDPTLSRRMWTKISLSTCKARLVCRC